jgi:hypothetical protein
MDKNVPFGRESMYVAKQASGSGNDNNKSSSNNNTNNREPMQQMMPSSNSYAQMIPDQDEVRKQSVKKQLSEMTKSDLQNLRYERLLRDSRAADLSDIAKLGFIYKSPRGRNGRTVIVILGRNLITSESSLDWNTVLLYIIRVMDTIVEKEYEMIYVHHNKEDSSSSSSTENSSTKNSSNTQTPELSWLQEVSRIFDRKYKKNLKDFFVVHSSFWVKMVFWTLSPLISTKFYKSKLKYVNSLAELGGYFDVGSLKIPVEIGEIDRKRGNSGSASDKHQPTEAALAAASDAANVPPPLPPQPSNVLEARRKNL